MTRDTLLKAYAADCLADHGKVVILGKSIDDIPGFEVPFIEIGWFQNRMVIKEFRVTVEILSKQSARSTIFVEVNLNAHLPDSMVNYIVKNLAGVVLYLFQQEVLKAQKDPDCVYQHRIREDKEFYGEWVLPKLNKFFTDRGWTDDNDVSTTLTPTPAPASSTTPTSPVPDANSI